MFDWAGPQKGFYEFLHNWSEAGHKLKFTLMTRSGKPFWWCTQCDQRVDKSTDIPKCKNNRPPKELNK